MSVLLICNPANDPSWDMSRLWLQINFLSSKPRAANNNNHLAGRCMVCQWAFLPVLPFESTTNDNVRKKRLWLQPVVGPIGCNGKFSERLLETAFGIENHESVNWQQLWCASLKSAWQLHAIMRQIKTEHRFVNNIWEKQDFFFLSQKY